MGVVTNIFAGYIFKELFIGQSAENNFWQNSIFFLEPLSTDHPPLWFLLLTPTLVLLSIPLAYYLFVKNKDLPKKEDMIGNPLSPYAVTKLVNELYASVFAKNYNFKTIGLRYFNIFDGYRWISDPQNT